MLRRWDDSQKYLSDNVHLVCEETANYLVIWCIDLEVEEVRADTAGWGVGRAQKVLPFFFLIIFFILFSSFMFVQNITVGMREKELHFKTLSGV